jgi:2-isopropylmalate synthase
MRDPATYEHVVPELLGNSRRVLVSDLSGKSNVLYKAAEMGIDITGNEANLPAVVKRIKELEHQGFQFEAAEGSLKVMLEQAVGDFQEFFRLEGYSVASECDYDLNVTSQATVRVWLNGEAREAVADGCGPVNALDRALRRALASDFECLNEVHLTDYKVRVLDADKATAAKVRVLIRSTDEDESWSTVGVSDNILDASWQALADAANYKLLKNHSRLEPVCEGKEGASVI